MKEKSEKPESREAAVKLLQQKLKALGVSNKNFITPLDMADVEFLPTGQVEVDSVLGAGGGIPRGTIIEFNGESQSGKTYLALKLMCEAQKRGEWVCFVNAENTFYPPRAAALGLNLNDPNSFRILTDLGAAEEYAQAVYAIIDSELYSVVVVDSLSALIPQDDFEKNIADVARIGAHAKFTKRFLKDLMPKCQRTNTIVVLVNQRYMGTGRMPGTMEETATGGKGITFFPHMRLWINKIGGAAGKIVRKNDSGEEEIIGGKSKLEVKKTRYGTPGLVTEFPIMFGDAESDPIAEFFYRAKARGNEYIREVRKSLKYTVPETGEVIESKDPVEMLDLLKAAPAPEKRTKNDNSTTALEYICGRLKMTNLDVEKLLNAASMRSSFEPDIEEDEE